MSLDAFASPVSATVVPSQPATSAPSLHEVPQPTETYEVAVVGLGDVGLPAALAFHAAGHRVLGIDTSAARLRAISEDRTDLLESDRPRLHAALVDEEGFTLTAEAAALAHAEIVIIAVPTPVDDHLMPDLGPLQQACATVVATAVTGQTIILTSTTYVGCTRELLVRPLSDKGLRAGLDIHVAFSPERTDAGDTSAALEDVPRVIGGVTPACTRAAAAALSRYVSSVHLVSSPEAAELTTLLESAYRAVNVAFVNEFSDISRGLGLDITEVIAAASTKPTGVTPFWPGAGVGGHWLPCNPRYLLWQLRKQRLRAPILEDSMAELAERPHQVVARAIQLLADRGVSLRAARVLVVGVTCKPDVRDTDASPALDILEELMRTGARVSFYDPLVDELRLPSGRKLQGLRNPRAVDVDLVIVHVQHSGQSLEWLPRNVILLDASFRLGRETGRHLV